MKKAKSSDETPLDRTRRLLNDGLTKLEDMMDDGARDDADDQARVLTRIAQVQAELRKADAEERRRGEALSIPIVLEWARSLSAGDRQVLLRELEHMNQKRSGLS